MTEHQIINNKNIWIKVDQFHVDRSNPNIIPTEYFTASYFFNEPVENADEGKIIKDEDEKPKLFESPVAALNYTSKKLEKIL